MKITFSNFSVENAVKVIEYLGRTYAYDIDAFTHYSLQDYFRFVADTINYEKDPIGIELICRPAITLKRMCGDCDDKTVMMVAYYNLKGYEYGISVVGSGSSYHHVFSFIVQDGQKIDMDSTYEGSVMGFRKNWNIRRNYL